jgi:hypothetical protein
VTKLFAHNVNSARALGFSPTGKLYAAGVDVYLLDIENQSSQKYADGGSTLAGDIAFMGNRLLMSTTDGDLLEVRENSTTRLGNLNRVAMNGMASTGPSTLYGFSDNRAFLINVDNLTLTPQFGLLVFTVAGATYLPAVTAHNPDQPLDVNGDGHVVPLDALLVINELNNPTFIDPDTGELVGAPTGETRFPDTNDDGFVTPADALLIINQLNAPNAVNAVMASSDAVNGGEATGIGDAWFDDLAAEIAVALGSLDDQPAKKRV